MTHKQHAEPLEVIYFTDINIENKSSEFGLYSNPKLKGLGQTLQ